MKLSHKEALKILDLPIRCMFDDIKKKYRLACSKYHPDRNPAGLEMMKLINAAYQALSDYNESMWADGDSDYLDETNATYSDELNAALNAVIGLGLTIEICGSWIWVSGDTKPHKEVLKAAGYRFAPKKVMWSFAAGERKSYSRGKFTMDEIRSAHGSVKVKARENKQIAA